MKDVMNEVFLGLGGNEGDRCENLSRSIEAIEQECGKVLLKSHVYETEAWGLDSNLKFLNQVIKIESLLSAEALLDRLLSIELKMGRVRSTHGYSDRTADLDILFFNRECLSSGKLQVPHPKLHLRKFVLVPLNEIASDWIHPVLKKSVSDLLAECADPLSVTLYKMRS